MLFKGVSQSLRFFLKITSFAVVVFVVLSLPGPLGLLMWGPSDHVQIHRTQVQNDEIPDINPTSQEKGGPFDAPKLDLVSRASNQTLERTLSWEEQHFLEAGRGPFRGTANFTTKFLTIGITTVYRPEEYIKTGLKSLIDQSWPEEREMATIVIFLADRDLELRNKSLKMIEENYSEYLDSGFIQVIIASPAIYPVMDESLPRKRVETLETTLWRTKQLVDASFIFSYVSQHNMSEYHVIVEDDNEASNQYITAIRDFARIKSSDGSKWGALEFANFVSIGVTFRSIDLDRLTKFLLFFFDEKPYDLLLHAFVEQEYSFEGMVLRRDPGIFQHFGLHSSLRSKLEGWTDKSFGQGRRQYESIRNPSALRISTTLQREKDYAAENAYSPAPGWFQGISQGESDTFDIVYAVAMGMERVIVLTGSSSGGNKMDKGKLLLGSGVNDPASNFCPNMTRVGGFSNGDIDLRLNGTQVQCIQIRIPNQSGTIIIREIKVNTTLT